jgi:hypothetical protein
MELRDTPGGPVYYLDELPLDAGAAIEVQLADGTWLAGEYAWGGEASRWPAMRIELAVRAGESAAADRRPTGVISIPPGSIVRRSAS